MALAPVPTAAPKLMPTSDISFGRSRYGFLSANKGKSEAKGYLNNSLFRGVNANAEISFDSAETLNESLPMEATEKLSKESSKLYFKAKKETRLEDKKSEKKSLTDLDISWNNLLPTSMYYIAETLGTNRFL